MAKAVAKAAQQAAVKVEINDSIEDLTRGSKVWYKKDEETWVAGELSSNPSATCNVQLENGQVVSVPNNVLQPANAALQDGIPDLTQLSYLNEPSILYDLKFRYASDQIYTFAGPVLIAVNPCKDLPLYTNEVAQKYKKGAKVYVNDLDPHIYLVAAAAFREMVREGKSQSLIVSGESGAGKTETTKKAMQYFATLAGGTGIEDQVLETNPILEAFGNAKTMRNHNSSRFGKLIEIHFNSSHHIAGARIRTYLLEKSRVVYQLQGERSYHIFYQLVKGATPEQKALYHLPDTVDAFNYLNQSGCTEIDTMDDAAEFKYVEGALRDLGVAEEALEELWGVLAGVLWLGNATFGVNKDDSAVLVQSEAAANACELLGVTHEALQRALCTRKIRTKDEEITTLLGVPAARDTRDAVAKAIYAGVFNWVVAQVNRKLDTGRGIGANCIAILDIYGFEAFQRNSFEQLCINYANERLQQQFNRHLFELEQQEYMAEGIDWAQVEFTDNQAVLDVIEAQPPKGLGVLAVLDSQCKFPKATDSTLLTSLKEALASHPHFSVVARAPEDFLLRHYAGAVQYNTIGFLDKNKDNLSPDVVETLVGSRLRMVAEIGTVLFEDGGDKKGTVGSRFSMQLKELMAMLDKTGLHFVRCIKPNPGLKPNEFSSGMTLQQLRCCGVLEVVRIARAGFPTRYLVPEFLERYGVLLPGGRKEGEAPLAAIQRLIDMFDIPEGQYQVGRTKIFFRAGVLGFVEDYWGRMHRSASAVQNFFRMVVARKRYLRMRAAALLVQSGVRATRHRCAYNVLVARHRAAHTIQRRWRAYQTRASYLAVRGSALTIQRYFWRWRVNKVFRAQREAREARELEARLAEEERKRREESFEAMQREFGVDMSDVKIALAAYMAAKKDPSALSKVNLQLQHTLSTAPTLAEVVTEAPAAAATAAALAAANAAPAPSDGPATPTSEQATAREAEPAEPVEEGPSKLDLQRLELQNMRLAKQLEREKSLRENNVSLLEGQAAVWVNQIRDMKLYIEQLKAEKQAEIDKLEAEKADILTQWEAERKRTMGGDYAPMANGFHSHPAHLQQGQQHPWSPEIRGAPRAAPGSSAGSSCGESPVSSPFSPYHHSHHSGPHEANPAADASYAAKFGNEFDYASTAMEDDVKFLVEVQQGLVQAPDCDAREEITKVKAKFKIWRRDFEKRIKTAEEVIKKIDRVQRQMTHHGASANGHAGENGHMDEPRKSRQGLLGRLLPSLPSLPSTHSK